MPRISQSRVQGYLRRAEIALTSAAKGAELEGLVAYLFGTVPGIRVTDRNEYSAFDTEEIDIACWNDHVPDGLSSAEFPAIILIECKNWSKPVSSIEVA